MLFKLSALASLLAAVPAVHSSAIHANGMSCGTAKLPAELESEYKSLDFNSSETFSAQASQAAVTINVYVHVVARNQGGNGWLSANAINTQIKVMNDDFAGTGFQYTLADTDYTTNANWASNYDEMGMKRRLRKGNYRDLNIYFLSEMNDKSGYCYYPISASPGSENFYRDGCTIGAWAAPGGSNSRFSTGRIGTHEAGHWHGLIHTFEGNNCNGYGDYVDDTPAQASASSGCPSSRNSCPNHPGLDPIHNHVDYTDDKCRYEFTRGQIQRMTTMWNNYRS